MSENDLGVMIRRAREFLEAGDKVRLVVTFSGRQITHPEFGHKVLDKTLQDLSDISKLDRERRLEGKKLIALISPERKKQDAKEENKEISS
jgi:translation initiation factor IF-3